MLKLKENQIKFCEEYVANDYNGSKAYQIAYPDASKETSASASSQMLRDTRIIEKIKEVEGQYRIIGHKLGIDKKLILKSLLGLLDAKKQVFFNGKLVGVADDNASKNKAIETLVKIMGDFSPEEKKITLTEDGEVDISKMTKEERDEYKQKLLRDL